MLKNVNYMTFSNLLASVSVSSLADPSGNPCLYIYNDHIHLRVLLREPILVHPPLLTCTPSRGNLKFPLRITQLHNKFSRQFKGIHMILSNLSTVILHCLKELQYRCFSTSFATYETLQTSLHPFGWKRVCKHVHLAALHLLPVWDLDLGFGKRTYWFPNLLSRLAFEELNELRRVYKYDCDSRFVWLQDISHPPWSVCRRSWKDTPWAVCHCGYVFQNPLSLDLLFPHDRIVYRRSDTSWSVQWRSIALWPSVFIEPFNQEFHIVIDLPRNGCVTEWCAMEISGFPEGVYVYLSKGGCTCKPGGCTGIGSLYLR